MAEVNPFRPVWVQVLHQASALGESREERWDRFRRGQSALAPEQRPEGETVFLGRIPRGLWEEWKSLAEAQGLSLSDFEVLVWRSVSAARQNAAEEFRDCPWILSTTKGNIAEWKPGQEETIRISHTAAKLARLLGMRRPPWVVSQACVSGLVALILAQRRISTGQEDRVLVTGADLISDFVLRGFQSFHALSAQPCRPFDQDRDGISLGEGVATLLLTAEKPRHAPSILLAAGSTTNDANHLSGPSRTGEELALAMERALDQAGVRPSEIHLVSAHGTGTVYNDEMEAKALGKMNLVDTPVHSLKGWIGHSLGAAGVLESALVMEAMEEGLVIPSLGYRTPGVSYPLSVTQSLITARLNTVLKTGSGFGGVNAALVFRCDEGRI